MPPKPLVNSQKMTQNVPFNHSPATSTPISRFADCLLLRVLTEEKNLICDIFKCTQYLLFALSSYKTVLQNLFLLFEKSCNEAGKFVYNRGIYSQIGYSGERQNALHTTFIRTVCEKTLTVYHNITTGMSFLTMKLVF